MSSQARLATALDARRVSDDDALVVLAEHTDLPTLTSAAAKLRDAGHGSVVSYSRKVFVPLTRLCRDVCHYCTFARTPRDDEPDFLSIEEMVDIAARGREAGCHEALFTLGDKPELRYRSARTSLRALGHARTLDYLCEAAGAVHEATGLLPHLNPGVMSREDLERLRGVSVSSGIMLESTSERLCDRGGPHYGSPDKRPRVRLDTLRAAGEAAVPFTTGILIGIGETRRERIESLLAIRELHERYRHIQEVIVQNFRAKPGTPMAGALEPSEEDLIWTLAVARLLLGAEMNIQAPPNLSPGGLERLVGAGINDWGGVSPVTPDHVNPEAPWPQLGALADETRRAGKTLIQRLAIYPGYVRDMARWVEPPLQTAVRKLVDAEGYPRHDDWTPGSTIPVPQIAGADSLPRAAAPASDPAASTIPVAPLSRIGSEIDRIVRRARDGVRLDEAQITQLFRARGEEIGAICRAADALRREVVGDEVTYVVNRNINYTNVCYFKCRFCAFSKGKLSENLRGRPYDLALEEIARRTREAWQRGATEVCLQGGIHPEYTGETYQRICRTVKSAAPGIHVHAFSPLEVWQGAATTGAALDDYITSLVDEGLGTLPGTAAEILDDEVRRDLCPDKLSTRQWLEVMETAHGLGISTTATIMYGHIEGLVHWARHLLRVRDLQAVTRGFTEFVPLPFVAQEAPIYLKGAARRGPTYREAVLMHAIARLVLHPLITNIQTSWVKMGPHGASACLAAGANDLGGTLMNESITRAAGATHGQEMPPEEMERIIASIDRVARQRTTLYADASPERRGSSFAAEPLSPTVETPARRYERRQRQHALVRPGLGS